MLMSFLGSIGTLMSDSGLAEVLECCYGPNTVIHMMTGKAVSRAMRGHFLVDLALKTMLIQSVLNSVNDNELSSNCSPHALTPADVDNLQSVYETVAKGQFDITDMSEAAECIQKLERTLAEYSLNLSTQSRTAKLCLQYVKYIQIVKDFIRAERTGSLDLHLCTVSKMLNLFAATGHNNYTKCGRLYLQMRIELPQ